MVVVISIPSVRLWKHYGSKVSVLTEEEKIQEVRLRDGRKWLKEWQRKKRGGAAAMLLLSLFLWKRPCSVCVRHCVVLPLAQATKASIYLSWASSLIEKRPWKAGTHNMCQGDMAFPLLTLFLRPECTQHNLHQSEGLLLPTNGEKKK